jgi:hypothetical protein
MIGAFLPLLQRRLAIDRENFYVLVMLLLFVGFSFVSWAAPEGRRKSGRIIAWVLTLVTLCGWGLTPLIHRISNKAILIFLALALLVASEWRYAHLQSANLDARSLGEELSAAKRDIQIWLAVTVSLVLLWQLVRLIL